MAELDEPADGPNFDLFGSFGFDFFNDDKQNKEKLLNKKNK